MRVLLGFEPASEVISWISRRIRETPFDRRTEELLNAAKVIDWPALLALTVMSAVAPNVVSLPAWLARTITLPAPETVSELPLIVPGPLTTE